MTERVSLPAVSTGYLGVVVLGAVVFEALYVAGFGDPANARFYTTLYSFNLLAIAAAVALLLWTYAAERSRVALLAGLAALSWFCGSLFFVSYVFLLGEALGYPSVAQFAFHGFHLLVIPAVLHVLERRGVPVWTPAAIPVLATSLVPLLSHLVIDTPLLVALYDAAYLPLVTASFALAAHLVYARVVPLLGAALSLFFVADLAFVATTLLEGGGFTFGLDPIWFTAHALLAVSVVRYAARGELP